MGLSCVFDDAVQCSSPQSDEHGLGYLIETEGRCLLFDTGQNAATLEVSNGTSIVAALA